jgi:hypothetical protein
MAQIAARFIGLVHGSVLRLWNGGGHRRRSPRGGAPPAMANLGHPGLIWNDIKSWRSSTMH